MSDFDTLMANLPDNVIGAIKAANMRDVVESLAPKYFQLGAVGGLGAAGVTIEGPITPAHVKAATSYSVYSSGFVWGTGDTLLTYQGTEIIFGTVAARGLCFGTGGTPTYPDVLSLQVFRGGQWIYLAADRAATVTDRVTGNDSWEWFQTKQVEIRPGEALKLFFASAAGNEANDGTALSDTDEVAITFSGSAGHRQPTDIEDANIGS